MRLGCCGDLTRLDAIVATGFDYVEPPVRALLPAGTDAEYAPVAERFAAVPIRPEGFNVFLPKEVPVVGPNVDDDRVDAHVTTAFARAASLGGEFIVFGSGGSRGIPDGWSRNRALGQVVAFLARIADRARSSGLVIVIEPLTAQACNFINGVPEAVEVAREVARPEVAVLADLYHMETDGQPLDDLASAGDYLRHVHVPVPAIPAVGGAPSPFDHAGFLARLADLGYDGRISIEDNGRRFTDFDTEAAPVREHILDLWNRTRA